MDLLGVSGGVGGGSGEGQGRRRPMEGPPQNHQHPPPQTCPRCNSTNTKFCYYNNYSLSQPRYFCKGCRRYWTQGGTLRNVPVGGGCRKSKRPKVSSSDATATSTRQPPLPSHQQQKGGTQLPGMVIGESSRTGASDMVSSMTLNPNLNLNPNPSLNPNVFYPGHGGGGFLSSLAAIQGITSNPGQPVNLGSNLSLLQGLGIPFSTQQQHQQGFYSLAGPGPGLTPSTDWNRALVGNPNPPTPTPETPFWSINSGNGSSINNNNNNNNNTDPGGSNPSQWADFPGSDGA